MTFGLSWSGKHAYWKCPKRYIDAGYPIKSVNLRLTGHRTDEKAPDRAEACKLHTDALNAWWSLQQCSHEGYGTWEYLIRRYRSDDYSPYASVKANTRAGYDYTCDKWLPIIGSMKIADLTFEAIKSIEQDMADNSDSAIHRMMTQLRSLASYGALIKETKTAARDVQQTLSGMTFRTPPVRTTFATRAQVEAIVSAADADDNFAWATGILMQFEFILRAVDVRGQWLKSEGTGGITRNGKRWQDGLTWEMFDKDLTCFEKVISKTARTMPEPYRFDLIPYLRDRIALLRPDGAVGPVFVSNSGLPYDQRTWTRLWAKYRETAGVPKDIKMMDVRASGATEARAAGADQFALRDAAQHANVATTSRYVRGRSDAAGDVVEMRQRWSE